MKISLYIPCFNAQKYIEFCLDGVLRQTYRIDEIIVVDDGSTDKTDEIVSKFPVRIIKHKINKGLAAARNTAIRNAKGEFIAALDADCVPEADWLENLMKNFTSQGIAGVGGRLLESYTSSVADIWRSVHMKQKHNKRFSQPPFLFGSNVVFRKENLLIVGSYNEKHRNNFEDFDISERLKSAGYTLKYQPKAIVHHLRKDNISSVLSTFWNWNLVYHQRQSHYKDGNRLCLKIKENAGLANRFIEEDLRGKRLQLLYPDFLLFMYLSLKDFIFFHGLPFSCKAHKENSFLTSYLDLLDLTFFYHFDSDELALKTFIPNADRFGQNLSAFLLIIGGLLSDKFNSLDFLKILFRDLMTILLKNSEQDANFLLNKILTMVELHRDWSGFAKKGQPNLDKKFLTTFSINFQKWIENLNYQTFAVLELIKTSAAAMEMERSA